VTTQRVRPPYKADADFLGAGLRIEQKFNDSLMLTSLTGFNHVKRADVTNQDGTRFEGSTRAQDGKIDSFSQELRLAGQTDALEWIVGGYYANDKLRDSKDLYAGQSSSAIRLRAVAALPIAQSLTTFTYSPAQITEGFRLIGVTANIKSESYAAFANATFALSEQLKITGGIRYTETKQSSLGCAVDIDNSTASVWNTAVALAVGGFSINAAPNACITYDKTFRQPSGLVSRSLKETNVAWQAGLSWTPSDSFLGYVNVRRGFKDGVMPVVPASVEGQLDPATQEKVTTFEAGAKARLFDDRLRFNLAGYYYDYIDKQLGGLVADPVFRALQKIINIPKSHAYGIEADAALRVTPELNVNVAGSWLKTRVDQFTGFDLFGRTLNYSGESFTFSPEWQLSGGVSYDKPIGDLRFGANIYANYSSSAFSQFGRDPLFKIDAHTLVDANARIYSGDKGWSVSVWSKNVFNKYYWNNAAYIQDTVVRYAGMPRTFGVTIGATIK
jgi:iron complex outermembrane receptor protein